MPGIHLRQPRFNYSVYGLSTKNKGGTKILKKHNI